MRSYFGWVSLALLAACGGGGSPAAPVAPAPAPRQLAITVQGLAAGDALVARTGNDSLTFNADGSKALALAQGAAYDVSLTTSPFESCTAANAKGSVGAADPAPIAITCTQRTAIGSFAEDVASVVVNGDTMYVAERGNQQVHVRRLSDNTEVLTIGKRGVTGSSDGAASDATFGSLGPMAWSPQIGLVMVDGCNGTLRVLGQQVRTLAGAPSPRCAAPVTVAARDGKGADAVFGGVSGIATAADGAIDVVDNGVLRHVGADGTVTTGATTDIPYDTVGGHGKAYAIAYGKGGRWFGLGGGTLAAVDADGKQTILYSVGTFNKWAYLSNLRAGPSGDAYVCLSGGGVEHSPLAVRFGADNKEVQRYQLSSCAFDVVGTGADEKAVGVAPLGTPLGAVGQGAWYAQPGLLPDGRIVTIGSDSQSFTVLSASAGGLQATPLPGKYEYPTQAIADANGHLGLLYGNNNSSTPQAVAVLDSGGAVLRTVPVGADWTSNFALAADGRVATAHDDALTIHAAGGNDVQVMHFQHQGTPVTVRNLAFDDNGRLYVVAIGTDYPFYLFTVEKNATSAVEVGAVGTDYPYMMAVAPGGALYFTNGSQVWSVAPNGAVSKPALDWRGPTVPGLAPGQPAITAVAIRGGWIYGMFQGGVMRARLP
ncbi:MAG: hypothetical protein ACXU8N_16810 [Telluria sp.]